MTYENASESLGISRSRQSRRVAEIPSQADELHQANPGDVNEIARRHNRSPNVWPVLHPGTERDNEAGEELEQNDDRRWGSRVDCAIFSSL